MATKMLALWWWIDRWRKSTAYTDMSLEEQGAYRNLIDEATLRGGALPVDERILAKACGDATKWRRVRENVLERFVVVDGVYRNETLDEVLRQSERRRTNQSNYRKRRAGDNGGDNGGDNKPANKAASPYPSPVQEEQKERTAPAALRPVEISRKPKASTWKRAIAIAHAVMDDYPDSVDWTPEFKARCDAQGIDYGQRGGQTQRALFSRAIDYVEAQRARRPKAMAS